MKPLDLKATKKALDEALYDPKERDDKEKKERRRRDREINDLRTVLAIPEGRRLLWRVLSEARMFQLSFTPGLSDVTAFNEGSRNVGNWLFGEINEAKSEAFLQMQREYKIEILNDKTEE